MSHLEGGTRLEITLKAMAKRFTSGVAEAGFFDAETAKVAWWNEKGVPDKNIPPRPFMRMSFIDGFVNWRESLRARLADGGTSREALRQVAAEMQQEIQAHLMEPGLYQENASRTIRKKGFDRPLFETGGVLYPAVRYRVTMRGR